MKLFAVADHVENVLSHHGSLAYYTDIRWVRGEHKTVHFMVLLDDAGIVRAADQFHLHGEIHGVD